MSNDMSTEGSRYVTSDVKKHGLKSRKVGSVSVFFMIFCLCCGGGFGIAELIPESGPGLTIIMLCVLPFIWSTPMGLAASELGSARPQEGGYYKWVQEALGEFWGFQSGWWRTISIYIDNTLYVILAAGYVGMMWDLSWGAEMAMKVGMILLFTYINLRGIKDVGVVSTIISLVVIFAFILVSICGFSNWNSNPLVPFTADGTITGVTGIPFADWVYYIGMGIAIGMWLYSGYESISTVAEEIENPQKVIPIAQALAVPAIMAAYIVPTIASLGSIGSWDQWGTEAGTISFPTVLAHYWGYGFGVFFVIVAVLSNCSLYNTYIASGSRGFFALADDYLAPPVLVKCDKKHGVPYVTVLSVSAVNLILCQFDFTTVIIIDMFLLVSSYVMIFISAMILRKRIPREEYKFRLPFRYKFFCVMCTIPCIVAFIAFFINGTDYFIGGMLGITSGPIMYIIWKRRYGGLTRKNAQLFPINPKTGLAVGDMKRISFIFAVIGGMGMLAQPWLRWFEGGWGPDYYLETYGSGFLSNFQGMLDAILIVAIIFIIIAIVCMVLAKKIESESYNINA